MTPSCYHRCCNLCFVVVHADTAAGSERPSDQLLLWAVEGLAGVVIDGIPNNVSGTRALNTPKAVLWGQHDTLLIWPGEPSLPLLQPSQWAPVNISGTLTMQMLLVVCTPNDFGCDNVLQHYTVLILVTSD